MFKFLAIIAFCGAVASAATRSCSPSDPTFMADPVDCSKYYHCAGTVYVANSCPGGLVWDADNNYCNWASAVKSGCTGGAAPAPETPEQPADQTETTKKTTTTTTTTTTTARPPPPAGGDMTCSSSEGYVYYPYGGTCGTHFYLCSNGKASGPFNCANSLVFSYNDQACRTPGRAGSGC